jgi:hypothetical protein
MRAVLPGLSLLLWGLFALSLGQGPFSSLQQELYYRWLPVCMAGAALVLILLRNAKHGAVAIQCVSLLMLIAFLPFLLLAGGGM